jgi:hypothetical protein
MIQALIEKAIIRGEKLSEEERSALLDWFARAENTAAPANPETGQISTPTQSDITAMVEQAMKASAPTYFPRLSDITSVMGKVVAGEFQAGNF